MYNTCTQFQNINTLYNKYQYILSMKYHYDAGANISTNLKCCWIPALNTSIDGEHATSDGNVFHNDIVAGKKEYLYALMLTIVCGFKEA